MMRSHCIREEGRKARCHWAKAMSVVTICQTGGVPIMAMLTCQVGNQVAHDGLQGHAAFQTKVFFRKEETEWRLLPAISSCFNIAKMHIPVVMQCNLNSYKIASNGCFFTRASKLQALTFHPRIVTNCIKSCFLHVAFGMN